MKLADKLAKAKYDYPTIWKEIIQDWKQSTNSDAAWLTYAANYLLITGGIRWAVDPFSMSTRVKGIAEPDYATDLGSLDFVLLTHAHSDHLDLNLIRALAQRPIKWIVPQHMLEKVVSETGIRKENIIIPTNGESIHIRNISITPFESLHFHALGGIDETGYLTEFNGKRWLFPGDIRKFEIDKLPTFKKLDGVFAHLWMGKGKAKDTRPKYINEFVNFHASLAPTKLIITHLDEFGRAEDELWDESHYILVSKEFHSVAPTMAVKMAKMGMKVIL